MKQLTRIEMKNVFGGYMPADGTCQGLFSNPNPGGPNVLLTGLSSEGAQTAEVHWCCDSCCTATWADHTGCAS